MRVLQVYKDYFPVLGGIENHLKLLAEGLQARGVDVSVLVTNTGLRTRQETVNGLPVVKCGRLLTIASAPLSLDFFRHFRRLKPDITHLHFPYPPGELAHLLFGDRSRLVITYHSDVIRQRYLLRVYAPLLRLLLKRADKIIVTSPVYAQSSVFLRPVLDKCLVIPLAIEVERFLNDKDNQPEIRSRFQPPFTLFVGHLRYYKGLDFLLNAMVTVPGQLLIAGSGSAEADYRRLADQLGISGRVHFLGEVPDAELPALYRSADVFVLPSIQRSEAFGLVQLEAMASAVPVVSTELGTGTSFVNRHGETGLVVPPRDPIALAAAIRHLLECPETRKRMGNAGRKRVCSLFSKETMLDRVMDLYGQLMAKK
ncbi:MAG: glycosyltransferase [Acidobacteria bacterium]|nr:MAG: glycosyltransferase [Acidobacteriota bacterium]